MTASTFALFKPTAWVTIITIRTGTTSRVTGKPGCRGHPLGVPLVEDHRDGP